MKNTSAKTTNMALCGLFAALTTICSWISIPLGFTPVPVNLATLAVFLAGGLLGPKYGPVSIAVYALAGAVGVPVFAGFRGGLGVLAGPTGGFVVGYIAAAFVTGLIIYSFNRNRAASSSPSTAASADSALSVAPACSGTFKMAAVCVLAMVAGLLACYLLGTLWFMISTGTGIGSALVMCVIPFLPGDVLKITAGTILIRKLHRFV